MPQICTRARKETVQISELQCMRLVVTNTVLVVFVRTASIHASVIIVNEGVALAETAKFRGVTVGTIDLAHAFCLYSVNPAERGQTKTCDLPCPRIALELERGRSKTTRG